MADAAVADEELAEATKRLADKAAPPPPPPEPVLDVAALLQPGSEKHLSLQLGEAFDLSGPEFSEADRADMAKIKQEALAAVAAAMRGTFAAVEAKIEQHKGLYNAKVEQFRKKRKGDDGAVAAGGGTDGSAAAASGASTEEVPKPEPTPREAADAEATRKKESIRRAAEAKAAAAAVGAADKEKVAPRGAGRGGGRPAAGAGQPRG